MKGLLGNLGLERPASEMREAIERSDCRGVHVVWGVSMKHDGEDLFGDNNLNNFTISYQEQGL